MKSAQEVPLFPKNLRVSNEFVSNIDVTYHAWLRFCQRYQKGIERSDSWSSTEFYVEKLKESFSRSYLRKVSPRWANIKQAKHKTKVSYFYDPETQFRFVVSLPNMCLITLRLTRNWRKGDRGKASLTSRQLKRLYLNRNNTNKERELEKRWEYLEMKIRTKRKNKPNPLLSEILKIIQELKTEEKRKAA